MDYPRRGLPAPDPTAERAGTLGTGLLDLLDDTKPRRAHRPENAVDRLTATNPHQALIDEALIEWITAHSDDPRVSLARRLLRHASHKLGHHEHHSHDQTRDPGIRPG